MIVSGNDDGNNAVRKVSGITPPEEQRILDFLQGAVYCWCKNRLGDWFSMRDLMGGVNRDWNGTPLFALYNNHIKDGKSLDEAFERAGKDGGKILKKVIADDNKLKFETKKDERIRKYRLIEETDTNP
ncbi:MAG: hypothetical protein Pg6C_01260 [Treponemataceae bacterium]|nr:MAG: hypothetical protein Pg6C_01260 [Treponemataceae bacterium]